MQVGDRVYYLYTDNNGVPIKFAAVILEQQAEGFLIRIGRYDVHTRDIATFESVVAATSLLPRSLPCSYEDELTEQV